MVENPKRSLIERMRDRMAERKVEGEQGSLILDILIGMAIFALIAIIAVSAIGQYRARAYEQSVTSDANSLGTAVEAYITDANGTFTAPTQTAATGIVLVGEDNIAFSNSGKNVLKWGTSPTAANEYTFTFCVVHDGAEWAMYDSATGGLDDSGRDIADAPSTCTA